MKLISSISLLMVISAFPAFAAEMMLANCKAKLIPVISRHLPKAAVSIEDRQVVCRYRTNVFKVHSIHKTGDISSTPHDEEGPNVDGLLLRITIHDGDRAAAADVPQEILRPYWRTFINTYPAGGGRYLWLSISYGHRTDKRLLQELKKLFGSLDPLVTEPTHNKTIDSTTK